MNIKKIGLSALAGSLVAFSANAIEMSVTGSSEITYSTHSGTAGNSTINPWGADTSLKFSATGDVGFGEATIVRKMNDVGNSGAFLSAWQTLDMGSMGTLSLDSTGGELAGYIPFDDILPTANEEVWHGVSNSGATAAGITQTTTNDAIGYTNSFGPIMVSLARSNGGTAATGDGNGNDTDVSTGTTSDYVVQAAVPGIDGLTLTYANSTHSFSAAGEDDDTATNMTAVYSTGPVSVGYRQAELQDGSNGVAGVNVTAYSLAFAVNDAMSVSVAQQDSEFDKTAGATNVTEEVTAINASYTIGAASMAIAVGESDNDNGTNQTAEYMELKVALSF